MRFRQAAFYFLICSLFSALNALAQVTVTIGPPGAQPANPRNGSQPKAPATNARSVPRGAFTTVFGGAALSPKTRDSNINYALDPSRERFFVYVPSNYAGTEAYGLVVFTDSADTITEVPYGWTNVLESRKLLFVAAQNAGNGQGYARRMGLAVLGALEMMKHYRIAPSRIYASGFSGGARVAGLLGFFQADMFRGTIQNCGADFYRAVPKLYATSSLDTAGQPYGIFHASPAEVAAARRVRFALITGAKDFRRGNILDVFYGGFAKSAIKAKLFDVPGMGHDTCDGATLSAALDFIEGAD